MPGGKKDRVYATSKDNARQLRRYNKLQESGGLSELQKAAIKEKKRKAALIAAHLKANADAIAEKEKEEAKKKRKEERKRRREEKRSPTRKNIKMKAAVKKTAAVKKKMTTKQKAAFAGTKIGDAILDAKPTTKTKKKKTVPIPKKGLKMHKTATKKMDMYKKGKVKKKGKK